MPYGIHQQQGMHAQGQGQFTPTIQNGYDPSVYSIDATGQVYYSQQPPTQHFMSQSQNGWQTRNASGPSQGVLYEQDGTQVVYNDSVWNMFMSNLGMDMGG